MSHAGTLTAAKITKHHGGSLILRDVTLVVGPRARIGLVGPNGAGKSTLLRILAGLEEPDEGTVRRSPPELSVGYLPQERELLQGETVRAYVERRTGVGRASAELDRITNRLAGDPRLVDEHARALDRFLALGGADLDARLNALCTDLGVDLDRSTDVAAVSGGEAARVQLAAVLLAQFDVFLLDEPTNDLDFDGLARLERFVADVDAAVVVVAHDRDFLDRTVARIVELDEWTRNARDYAGGWTDYEAARELARRQHEDAYGEFVDERQRLREQLQRMQDWERRGYGQGRKKKKTKDVKSAIGGRVERLGTVEKPYEPWQLQLSFGAGSRAGDVVVRLRDAVLRRGTFELGPLDLQLNVGDRLAVVGPNGSGKSTLLAALLGTIEPARGERWLGPGIVAGELDQRRDAPTTSVLDALVSASDLTAEAARTLLAKFGLGAGDVLRPASSLSPGERTRSLLAGLAAARVNFLVLDEPTNHLDVAAIEELERALDAFKGTIALVTHDRRFLERFRASRTLRLPPTPRRTGAAAAR